MVALFGLVLWFNVPFTAMVMSRRSVDLTTLFSWASLDEAVNQYFMHILSPVTDRWVKVQNFQILNF